MAALIARNEPLLLELCESERGNIVVTIVEISAVSLLVRGPEAATSPSGATRGSRGHASAYSTKSPHSPPRKNSSMLSQDSGDHTGSELLVHDAEVILSVVLQHCWRLCTSQGGCIALTRLFDVLPPHQRTLLEDFVVDHFLALAVHPFGNFVVQMIIQRQEDDDGVLRSILIHVSIPTSVIAIASSKFGSHVLEAFFRHASPLLCCTAMQRLLSDEETVRFLVTDKFGNYVVQQGMRRLTQQVKAESRRSSPKRQERETSTTKEPIVKVTTLPHSKDHTAPADVSLLGSSSLDVEMLPTNVDIAAMRESFIAKIIPHLRESPFCQNISKALGLRKTPTSPQVTECLRKTPTSPQQNDRLKNADKSADD
jgi:hypothetical protein